MLLISFLSGNYYLFVLEAIIEGCAWFLNSGTFDAYVYNHYSNDEYLAKMARIGNIGEVGFILSTLTYAALFRIGGIPLLILCTVISNSIGLFILLFIPKDASLPTPGDEDKPKYTLHDFFSDSRVISGIIFGASTSILGVVVNFFYIDKLVSCGLPEELMSGIIIAYTLVNLLDEPILRILKKKYYSAAFIVTVGISVGSVVAFALITGKIPVIAIMVFLPLTLSIPGYIFNEFTNHIIDSYEQQDKRATIMSVFSMGGNTVDIVVLFGSALLVSKGVTFWYLLTAAFMGITGILYFICMQKKRLS